ncbi:Gfo/Idh/MocA family oxidoreductase [Ruminococcus sp.]|jgi:predicted dehydrogenase|uniref:Gfo/Idh/MocA family protein n=1 Tax=Ruminococcus sp. TaxID=41978 RepID=UPI002605CDE8|nr:Gfo/Idh/MocA family oxidoreductase [Ruminococcus sp.]MCI2113163.1 Gfo/Idh/MocA family oxidoreductase [Ruminococcus sp.]MDD6989575.1 Gfo/Idh/MocA family oxidoreductase [Ruminococcus sp.]MDY6201769.1 Gfo/Idh/MocA family oxidoreductase [Ruminococcus sp.]
MDKNLNWAVLGTGVIANQMAQALQKMGKNLYAVANRTHSKALSFAEKYGVEKVYDSIDEVFTDENVDIIYITTPHNTHIQYIRKALENKKHVFCEKAITLNSGELEEAVKLAEENGVIIAEAMTIWHMPLYKKLWQIAQSGKLGKLQLIQLNFGSFKDYDMSNRFFNINLAGGALLDIGVYSLSLARSFMSSQPKEVKSQVKFAESGVDEQASIIMMNDESEMATITLSLHSKQPKRAVISFEKGYIEIMEYPRADKAFIVDAETGEKTEILEGKTELALMYEMEDMEHAVKSGDLSGLKLDNTIDVMKIMTDLRKEWGLVYPEERR